MKNQVQDKKAHFVGMTKNECLNALKCMRYLAQLFNDEEACDGFSYYLSIDDEIDGIDVEYFAEHPDDLSEHIELFGRCFRQATR